MLIQINAGDHIQGGEALDSSVSGYLEAELDRFRAQLSRVEVHMSDENAGKGGDRDKRCMIEARLDGRPPIAVTELAATMKEALDGATAKLVRLLDKTVDRQHEHRKHTPQPPLAPVPDTE